MLILLSAAVLSGCGKKVVIEPAVSEVFAQNPKENVEVQDIITESRAEKEARPGIVHVESGSLDRDAVIKAFLGMSREEAEQYRPSSYYAYLEKQGAGEISQDIYERDGTTLTIATESLSGNTMIEYSLPAAGHYTGLFSSLGLLDEGLDEGLRDILPDEGLVSYSKENAIADCSEVISACGYGDADISAYALSLERIEALRNMKGISEIAPDAPDPAVVPATLEEIYSLRLKIQEAEEAGDQSSMEELKLCEQTLWENRNMDKKTGLPWKKEDEGLLLICRPKLNGLVMDSFVQWLEIICAPGKGIIYASAHAPYIQKGMPEQTELITKEKAAAVALQLLGLEDAEELEIFGASMVYAVRATQAAEEDPTVSPCWRLDCRLLVKRAGMDSDRSFTIWIDAVTGVQSRYSEVW